MRPWRVVLGAMLIGWICSASAEPRRASAPAGVFSAPDRAKGKRVARKTAVLLVAPRPGAGDDDSLAPTRELRFQPVACAIDGKLVTGTKCGEIMPARAQVRTPTGTVTAARSTRKVHPRTDDDDQDFAAPYGPACCNYKRCDGQVVPYTATTKQAAPRTVFGVWPPDADIKLETAGDGIDGVAAADLPVAGADEAVEQAFARGTRKFAVVGTRIEWNVGAGWVTAAQHPLGARGYRLLATSDLDGDGHLELVAYALWANDFGLDVLVDSDPKPIYGFSCGNI